MDKNRKCEKLVSRYIDPRLNSEFHLKDIDQERKRQTSSLQDYTYDEIAYQLNCLSDTNVMLSNHLEQLNHEYQSLHGELNDLRLRFGIREEPIKETPQIYRMAGAISTFLVLICMSVALFSWISRDKGSFLTPYDPYEAKIYEVCSSFDQTGVVEYRYKDYSFYLYNGTPIANPRTPQYFYIIELENTNGLELNFYSDDWSSSQIVQTSGFYLLNQNGEDIKGFVIHAEFTSGQTTQYLTFTL